MNSPNAAVSPAFECPSPLISGYLDGELTVAEESAFESHLRECRTCSEALLDQRQVLCLLSSSLAMPAEIEPPTDFAKKVTAKAESNVNGLRRPEERLNAYFVAAAMALFCLFAFFSYADIAAIAVKAGDAVAGSITVAIHFLTSFYSGVVVITRSASSHIAVQTAFTLLLLLAAIFMLPAVRRAAFRRS
jgi:anti-sigma factor RsiW